MVIKLVGHQLKTKMKRHNFRELLVWQLAMDVVDDIYTLTKNFPKEELFGLSLQMRKCSISIPSNIAEGCGRNSDQQLLYFTDVSQGSAFELETQLLISIRQDYITTTDSKLVLDKLSQVQKMLDGFQNRFR